MNRWLLSAIICWTFSLTLWVSYSWGGSMPENTIWDIFKDEKKAEDTFEHFCVTSAMRDAWTWEIRTGRPARIATSKIKNDSTGDIDHVQAEGLDEDGQWVPLTTHNTDGKLRKWKPHFDAKPYKYWTLDEFVDSQKGVRAAHLKSKK